MNAFAGVLKTVDWSALRIPSGIFSGLAMRHLALAVAFTAGYDILGQLGLLGLPELTLASRLKSFTQMPLHLAIACIAVVAAVAADNTMKSGAARLLRYPAAVLGAAVAGGVLMAWFLPPVFNHDAKVLAILTQLGNAHLFLLARQFLMALYICTLVIALYAVLEENHRASSALHQARLRALDEQRDVCAAELSAMQARVDPELLFESLRAVDQAYASDSASGQARLDALIRFLRAALPGKTALMSTIRLEKELAAAYVALVSPDQAAPPQIFSDASPALLDERIPPMIVLPMVRWALADAAVASLTVAARRSVAAADATLELTVGNRDAGTSGKHDDAIDIVRERLQRLYGNGADICLSTVPGNRLAVATFPADSGRLGSSPAASTGHTHRE